MRVPKQINDCLYGIEQQANDQVVIAVFLLEALKMICDQGKGLPATASKFFVDLKNVYNKIAMKLFPYLRGGNGDISQVFNQSSTPGHQTSTYRVNQSRLKQAEPSLWQAYSTVHLKSSQLPDGIKIVDICNEITSILITMPTAVMAKLVREHVNTYNTLREDLRKMVFMALSRLQHLCDTYLTRSEELSTTVTELNKKISQSQQAPAQPQPQLQIAESDTPVNTTSIPVPEKTMAVNHTQAMEQDSFVTLKRYLTELLKEKIIAEEQFKSLTLLIEYVKNTCKTQPRQKSLKEEPKSEIEVGMQIRDFYLPELLKAMVERKFVSQFDNMKQKFSAVNIQSISFQDFMVKLQRQSCGEISEWRAISEQNAKRFFDCLKKVFHNGVVVPMDRDYVKALTVKAQQVRVKTLSAPTFSATLRKHERSGDSTANRSKHSKTSSHSEGPK